MLLFLWFPSKKSSDTHYMQNSYYPHSLSGVNGTTVFYLRVQSRPPSEPSEARRARRLSTNRPSKARRRTPLITFAVWSGHRYGFPPACPKPAAERAERSEASEAAVDEPTDSQATCSAARMPLRLLGGQCWYASSSYMKGRPWKKKTQLAQHHVFHTQALCKLEQGQAQT